MFLFAKIAAFLLLPPGIFLLGLFGALFFFQRRARGPGMFLLWAVVLSLYLLSTGPVKNALVVPLEDSYPHPGFGALSCDVIVVLGGGIVPNAPDAGGGAAISAGTARRVFAAFRVWQARRVPLILSGGSVWGRNGSEAVPMADHLAVLGVPRSFLVTEERSRDTFENAKYSAQILSACGWREPCLVTSAFHLLRAMRLFAFFDVRAIPVPSDYRGSRAPISWRSFLPGMDHLATSYTALRERLALLYNRLFLGA